MTDLLPLLRTQLNMDDSDTEDIAALEAMLAAAVEVVEGIVGPLSQVAVTETLAPGELILANAPVSSVVMLDAGGTVVTDAVVNEAAGLIRSPAYGTRTVTYLAGRAEPTAAQQLAILIVASHLWETRRGAAATPISEDGYTLVPGLGFAIPARARELLASTALGPSVA